MSLEEEEGKVNRRWRVKVGFCPPPTEMLSHIDTKQLPVRQASADPPGPNQLHFPQVQAGSGRHLAGPVFAAGARVTGHTG